MALSSKRAEKLALAGLVISVVFFVATLLVSKWSGFFAIYATSWLILSAALVWVVLVIQFHQRALAEQEKLDISQLTDAKQGSTIFQDRDKESSAFAVAEKRLRILEKWFVPIFSALIALYQIALGLYLLNVLHSGFGDQTQRPLICAVCMMAVAFVCFIISRYATGMSAQPQWKPLRAGGSILLGVAILCFVLAIGLALVQFKISTIVNVIDFVIPILLLLLGIENALNTVLDIYRPRLKGKYSRTAFDSRLLGLMSEPGGIFYTAAGAIDYQFGFKVSQTWFYQLLEKVFVPLLLFAVLVLYAMSCIVIVAPNEQAVIEHFGNPVETAGPGLTFKWPWPIDIAYKYPTEKIAEINIGFEPELDPHGHVRVRPLLWGQKHHQEEHYFLVASEQTATSSVASAVPVSLIIAAVPVHYKIKDLHSYIYNHEQPEKLLEAICYRELTRFAASAKIEVDSESVETDESNQSLLGAGRTHAKNVLTERIQTAADDTGLGVEIVFVGLQGIHPPTEVAPDYQQVVGAVQKKQAQILWAMAGRNSVLTSLAGSIDEADLLYRLAAEYQQAKDKNQTEKAEELASELDRAFSSANGDIFKTLREAQSYAFEKAILAEATGRRFASQQQAYNAAKEIYLQQQRLTTFEEALEKVRKFVVVADTNDTQVFIVDVQEKLTPSLYEMSGFQENTQK